MILGYCRHGGLVPGDLSFVLPVVRLEQFRIRLTVVTLREVVIVVYRDKVFKVLDGN